jgi:hypothetical protein
MIGSLGVLDRVLNTPANHRMHHDVELSRGAVNLGGILIVWDRLFGTYAPAREVRQCGLAGRSAGFVVAVYSSPVIEAFRGRRSSWQSSRRVLRGRRSGPESPHTTPSKHNERPWNKKPPRRVLVSQSCELGAVTVVVDCIHG